MILHYCRWIVGGKVWAQKSSWICKTSIDEAKLLKCYKYSINCMRTIQIKSFPLQTEESCASSCEPIHVSLSVTSLVRRGHPLEFLSIFNEFTPRKLRPFSASAACNVPSSEEESKRVEVRMVDRCACSFPLISPIYTALTVTVIIS